MTSEARDTSETGKTKEQLVSELTEAHRRIAELEASEAECKRVEESHRKALAEALQATEALRESEERYRSIVESIDLGLNLIDCDHNIVMINAAQGRHFNKSPREVVGKKCFWEFEKRDSVCPYCPGVKAIATGRPAEVETEGVRDDGSRFLVRLQAFPVLGQDGAVKGFVEIGQDITKRRKAEEALQQAYEQVEQQVEERTAELQREIAERERAQEESMRLQQAVIEAQKRALQELSTPIIPVMEHIIIMPLIGSIDTMRAKDITRALLAGIREHHAKVVILDITGVPVVDSGVATYLNRTIQAARLKGTRTIITGISEVVAETIVDLGIDWSGIETLRDLQTGLRVAMIGMEQRGER
jgi:PAS domain S-box-containing protein